MIRYALAHCAPLTMSSLGNGMTFPLNERAWRELQQKAAEAEAERQRLRQEQLERMQQERRMSQSA